MSVNDVLFVTIRWVHAIAAVSWVGGGLFYLLILKPRLKAFPSDANAAIVQDFRALVTTAMGMLLVTGVILTFDRLTSGSTGVAYVAVLSVKIGMALYMFYTVRFLGSRTYPADPPRRSWTTPLTSGTAVVALGIIVFLLADVLSALFEQGLKG